MINNKVYFAHPISDYNSPREKKCLKLIRNRFTIYKGELVNPNDSTHQKGYQFIGMSYFLQLAATCSFIIAVPFEDGEYGMGVYKEIESVVSNGGVLYTLNPETKEFGEGIDFKDIRPLSINETRLRIRKDK